jgi:ParB-like chromosome segregation protein Spo0J
MNLAPNVELLSIHDLFSQDATRLSRDEEHINALAADFRQRLRDHPDQHPVQTPLRVIRRGDKYLIVTGNNRYEAGLRAALQNMPCIILPDDLDEAGLLIEQAKDNEMRRGYTPLERARFVLRVVELRGVSQAEAGRLLGIKAAEVTKLLSVLKHYPEDLHPLIGEGDGKVPVTTAYAFSRLHPDEHKIRELTDRVVKGLLSRDDAVIVVDGILNGGKKKQKKCKPTKFRTSGGVVIITPGGMNCAEARAELARVDEAMKRCERHGLPMSSLPNLLKSA